ncbi:uncharacterized protein [Choristoneura fumiferana]|uniref:uncharacterized protein n=1 Tax=Choristoneura fumiferana TaxID=7141 RepID=UPI003D155F97
MEKLKFKFAVKAGEDPKTNIICITSITDVNNQTFLLPDELQPVKLHDTIIKTEAFAKVRKTLQRRHDQRQVWISMTTEISNVYIDEDGNMQFKGYLLEEAPLEARQQVSTTGISEEVLARILQTCAEMNKDIPKPQNVRNVTDKFVIEKFTRKTSNVFQWMTIFEAECTRLGLEEDLKKIEALRLFLEDSCVDWYTSMLIKYTINSDWLIWKKSFCDTYADKGWSPVRYALLFKYRQGSLLEYAIKKERLLLEMNKTIDTPTLMDLIATGLPHYIADKIDRKTLKQTEDLFNNIRGLEHLVRKQNNGVLGKNNEKEEKVRPCGICEKENKGIRYHPESLCWFKNIGTRPKREYIRSVNNSELETELNQIDPKN